MNSYKNRFDVNTIKRELTRTLMDRIKENEKETVKALLYSGYSYNEIMELINNYEAASGLDLINCNEIAEKALTR